MICRRAYSRTRTPWEREYGWGAGGGGGGGARGLAGGVPVRRVATRRQPRGDSDGLGRGHRPRLGLRNLPGLASGEQEPAGSSAARMMAPGCVATAFVTSLVMGA